MFDNYLYVSSTAASFREHFAKASEHYIEKFKLNSNDLVVDIGSNDGIALKPLMDKGIKVLGVEGSGQHIITKTKVRHILVKTNELVDDTEARKRLLALRERIVDGDDFAALSRAHSDDKGSAINGGSLDWVTPGALVPPFEEAMNKLEINQVSQPVQTQFGWHLIQVLGRENQDNSDQFKKDKIRDELRKRKIEEETELWLRRLRDEAFVEIEAERL
jgi:peptidyl-prolyl cis-trans isomerase SurA